jgi:DNA (cytosine-5)-methyltransferase 1
MPKPNASRASPIPVIDLFAGPGGLGEGFSAFRDNGRQRFDVKLSIEKDEAACATLILRNFCRQFEKFPPKLVRYFAGKIARTEAFAAHPREAVQAQSAVWRAELGKVSPQDVARNVRDCVRGSTDWVLLGGPPCQAYSIAGRSRMRSTHPDFERDERHFLYREYLQIVADHEPAVFVLENVKGLLTSTHSGKKIVTRILDDLSAPGKALGISRRGAQGYRLYTLGQRQATLPWMEEDPQDGEEFLVKAEEFGIPQMRHRVFIVGVRADVPGRPAALQRTPEVSAGDVLSDLPLIRSRLTREEDSLESWRRAVTAIRRCDWMSSGDPKLAPVAREIGRVLTKLSKTKLGSGAAYVEHSGAPAALGMWYRDNAVGLTHHEARAHMRSDLHRYMFAAAFAQVYSRSPEIRDFPEELRPAHRNIAAVLEGSEIFNDRFRVQFKDRPSTTITAHISKDGHYYIHYDLAQCRSLTVREAARLQTFPDNYFFEGNRTEQYHQIGNAVPPVLALQIARLVYELLESAGRVNSGARSPGRESSTRSGGAERAQAAKSTQFR